MRLVVTHINPDFDAIASAYAALILHECDYIVLATGLDESITRFLKDSNIHLPVKHLNEIDVEKIDLLIITDCKIKERLGDAAVLVEKSEKVLIYDHHPVSGKDIEADDEFVFNFGSTSTIITERLKIKGIDLDEDVATLLLLGIYEDTGFLSFTSTTAKDLYAAAFLIENNADISAVNIYIKKDLNKYQIFILNQLLQNLSILKFTGLTVGVSYASCDEYVEDVAVLTNKIMSIEGLDALFILVRVEDRVVFIGRSNVEEIDVSTIAEGFKGGGHPYAASAVIKDMTLQESLEKLKYLIRENIRPVKFAKDFMTTPVKYLNYDTKFSEAVEIFMKYNLNTMPVVKNDKTLGLISRKDILHGVKHGLNNEPVSSIMQTEFHTVTPETPFDVVEDIILNRRQKLVPVESDGKLVGVITRTDFLRAMSETSKTPKYMMRNLIGIDSKRFKNVKNLLKDRLPDKIYNLLIEVGELAQELGMNAYVVGGFVRDLIMKIENFDVDIVVEGNAITLAKRYVKRKGGKVAAHYKFKTAVVILDDGFRIDFATARIEYYDFPAAAPIVEDSSIKTDLYRRDFTINSMAIKLNKDEFGNLLDFFGGQADIRDKKIRVLHNLSFVDDPSRIFRAIRFAVRFGFQIGPHTERLLKHAIHLKLLDRIVGQRLFLEIKYILCEKNYTEALKIMDSYGVLKFFHDAVVMDNSRIAQFEYMDRLLNWFNVQFKEDVDVWKPRFALLFQPLKGKDLQRLLKRFDFHKSMLKNMLSQILKAKNTALKMKKEKTLTPSYVYNLLSNIEKDFIFYLATLLGEKYEEYIKNYFTKYRFVKLEINGDTLKKMGYKPSERFKKVLTKLLEMKLDGLLKNREDEINMAKRLFEECE